jgi:hypothetical protein
VYDRAKACIYASGAYFEFKKKVRVFDLKKISPQTFEPHCSTVSVQTNVIVFG